MSENIFSLTLTSSGITKSPQAIYARQINSTEYIQRQSEPPNCFSKWSFTVAAHDCESRANFISANSLILQIVSGTCISFNILFLLIYLLLFTLSMGLINKHPGIL